MGRLAAMGQNFSDSLPKAGTYARSMFYKFYNDIKIWGNFKGHWYLKFTLSLIKNTACICFCPGGALALVGFDHERGQSSAAAAAPANWLIMIMFRPSAKHDHDYPVGN